MKGGEPARRSSSASNEPRRRMRRGHRGCRRRRGSQPLSAASLAALVDAAAASAMDPGRAYAPDAAAAFAASSSLSRRATSLTSVATSPSRVTPGGKAQDPERTERSASTASSRVRLGALRLHGSKGRQLDAVHLRSGLRLGPGLLLRAKPLVHQGVRGVPRRLRRLGRADDVPARPFHRAARGAVTPEQKFERLHLDPPRLGASLGVPERLRRLLHALARDPRRGDEFRGSDDLQPRVRVGMRLDKRGPSLNPTLNPRLSRKKKTKKTKTPRARVPSRRRPRARVPPP